METVRETNYYSEKRRCGSLVSWAAIFGGTLIMIVTMMLLSLLGVGIGIGSINPMEEAHPFQGIGTGALIWWVISNIMAVFAGAFTAAKLTKVGYKFSGVMHGLLTWSLYTLISFWLMTSAIGGILSGVGSVVSKSLSAVGMGVSKVASLEDQVDTDRINRLIQNTLAKDQKMGSDSTKTKEFNIDLMAVVQEVVIKDGKINKNIDRAEVVKSVAKNSTLSRQDAERAADVVMEEYAKLEQKMQELEEKAKETGQKVAEAVSKAAIWGFVALLIGAITAAVGGHLGKRDVACVDDTHRS